MSFYLDPSSAAIIDNDIQELVAMVRQKISQYQSTIIAIDGVNGSGNSTVSRNLAAALKSEYVEADKFLPQDGTQEGVYLDALDLNSMSSVIRAAIAVALPLVIDGVCVLNTLNRLKLKADVLIYVRRMTQMGFVGDMGFCGADEDREANRADIQEAHGDAPSLAREVLEYHQEQKPHLIADIIYERQDVDPLIGHESEA